MAATVSHLSVHSITPREGVACGELLTVEAVGEADTLRPPHRHTFAQLVFIESGVGNHLIDFSPVEIRPGDVHVLAPGQVHTWEAEGLRGQALMFSEELLDSLGTLPHELRELTLLGAAPLRLTRDAQAQALRLFEALSNTRSERAGRHLVTAMLWECLSGTDAASPIHDHSSLASAFLKLALTAPHAGLTVSACARELGVTNGYLTESVVAGTGTSPGKILRTAVTREAQRLLSGTELTSAQISHQLGFTEPSYFSRFFRREVGCTPSEYRAVPPSDRAVPVASPV